LLFLVYHVNTGTSPRKAGIGSSRRGIPDSEGASRRAGRGAEKELGRDSTVPLRLIDAKDGDAKDHQINQ